MGALVFAGQTFSFATDNKAQVPAVLGLDILMRFRVLMDLPADKMYLAPAVSLAPLVPQVQIKPAAAIPNTQP